MDDFDQAIDAILTRDPRYGRGAYHFLREALDYSQEKLLKSAGKGRHLTGQELLQGIREYALQQFGPMTLTVFDDWGIHSCPDWGEIVYHLIDQKILSKTDTDSKSDFASVYDFQEVFRQPFLPAGGQG